MDKFWTWIEKLPLYKFFNTHRIFGKICNREVLSYLFFGVLTTVVSLVTFWLPDRLFSAVGYPGVLHYILHSEKNFAYVESNVLSWICAVTFAFVTNKLFVFASKARDKKTVLRELSSFVGGRLTTLLVDTALMFLLVTVLLMGEMLSKVLVQVVIVILNYFISKLLVFRNNADKGESK
ncbi:MAG: GtrA family protein [Acutalibacteraceae bacterium]